MEDIKDVLINQNSKIKLRSPDIVKENVLKHYELPIVLPKLEQWYNNLPNKILKISIKTSDIIIYPKESIHSCMEGYRFILYGNNVWKDLSKDNGWNKEWILLATYNDNPIIADLSDKNIPVKFDYVGGIFDFKNCLVDKIEKFKCFITALITSFEYNGFMHKLKNELKNTEIDIILNFFGIDEFTINKNGKIKEEKVYKNEIYLQELGKNKTKVLLQIKKYLKNDIHEIMELTKKLPVKLFEGFGENIIEYAKELEKLDAKIKIEKKEIK